ncbi:Bestrophin, partial [Trichostrongylus colubriformis]
FADECSYRSKLCQYHTQRHFVRVHMKSHFLPFESHIYLLELSQGHQFKEGMTVSYSGNFVRLLLRWKGSIWRLVWVELVAFLLLFYAIKLFYIHAIPIIDPGEELEFKKKFHMLCKECNEYTRLIPLTFLLGFYVTTVVSRRDVSDKIRLRFPTVHSLVDAGLMTESEFILLEKLESPSPGVRWMAPLLWIQQLVSIEVESGRAATNYLPVFSNEMKSYRKSFRKLFCHDWVCVPLVYTQVASLATYSFFVFCLFGRQHLGAEDGFDTVFPFFTVVQFMFYVGWYKVGQDLMRPFGLDDDDIELSYIFDRNLVISFAIVDFIQTHPAPKFEEDVYWRYLQYSSNLPTDSQLKFGRIDLSRAAHKHPPKLHTYVQVRRDEKILVTDKPSQDRPQRYIAW